MAAKKKTPRKSKSEPNAEATKAKYAYTTKPGSLRKLLQLIPTKPKPTKFDKALMHSWGFKDSNDMTILRVLKEVNLINDRNEPTAIYVQFMSLKDGAKALGPEIKRVYEPLFQAAHKPYDEDNQQLKNLFNIHSGGGERNIEFQIQTFKALCENASFDGSPVGNGAQVSAEGSSNSTGSAATGGGSAQAHVNINLHIHLPENKTRRDYEAIIEDIGHYIFGRVSGERSGS